MPLPTLERLTRYLKDGRRRQALIIGELEIDVRNKAALARSFGYRPLTEVLQSETTHEWYQWWKRWDVRKRQP